MVPSVEALARAHSVFGPAGPDVRVTVPRVLIEAHDLVVAHHVGLDLSSEDAYGLIWLKLPQLLVDELVGVAGARIVRPRRSRIQYAVINGVPVVAWRYGKRVDSTIDQAVYGVSAARRSLFEEHDTEPELDLDWGQDERDEVVSGLSDTERAEIAAHCAAIRSMSADGQLVAVLAFASSPAGVHCVYFGYADLAENGCLHWRFREKIDPIDQVSHTQVPTPRSTTEAAETFASGPVATPILRPRQRPTAP